MRDQSIIWESELHTCNVVKPYSLSSDEQPDKCSPCNSWSWVPLLSNSDKDMLTKGARNIDVRRYCRGSTCWHYMRRRIEEKLGLSLAYHLTLIPVFFDRSTRSPAMYQIRIISHRVQPLRTILNFLQCPAKYIEWTCRRCRLERPCTHNPLTSKFQSMLIIILTLADIEPWHSRQACVKCMFYI